MTPLCRLDEIPDPGARGPFAVELDGGRAAVFVVRRGGEVFAYVDSCPHAGAPLEMEPDRFLDLTGTEILCSLHGARFALESGLCVAGPCRGRRLRPYPIRVSHGTIMGGSGPKGI